MHLELFLTNKRCLLFHQPCKQAFYITNVFTRKQIMTMIVGFKNKSRAEQSRAENMNGVEQNGIECNRP